MDNKFYKLFKLSTGLIVHGNSTGDILTAMSDHTPDNNVPFTSERITTNAVVPDRVRMYRYNHGPSFYNIGFDAEAVPPCYYWLCANVI